MPKKILAKPNVHPILDPEWAADVISRHCQDQIATLKEIALFGADTIRRIGTANVSSYGDALCVTCLFRQALVSFDAGIVCLENAAVQGSLAHARTLFEAHMYLSWVFAGDKDRLIRQWYVGALRAELEWANRNIPGTPANEENLRLWAEFGVQAPGDTTDLEKKSRDRKGEIETLLASDEFREINRYFDGSKKPHQRWFQVGPGSVRSIFALARKLGMEAEYVSLYRFNSAYVHGDALSAHARLNRETGISVVPIRYPEQFGLALRQFVPRAVLVYKQVLEQYRPGEVAQLVGRYAEDWRPRLQVPDFEMIREEP